MTLITDASEIPELAFLNFKKGGTTENVEEAAVSPSGVASDEEVDEFLTFSHDELAECLLNKSGKVPLPARFRALFALKYLGDERAIEIIGQGKRMNDVLSHIIYNTFVAFTDNSALLKHELAYVLGQIRNPIAIPVLNEVLADCQQDPMVRHEAGEALGAIGALESIPVLQQYCTPEENVAVRETCEIAIDNILKNHQATDAVKAQLDADSEGSLMFGSVDPAPPAKVLLPTATLRAQLLDTSLALFERYKAMFALRNQGTKESTLALCDGLEDESALFRHEIGYVLGQLKEPVSVPALARALAKTEEAPMVRHECAEALGSIASEECLQILQQYINDPVDVVKESCLVALDMYEYETTDQFMFLDKEEMAEK
jgi:deoxyhypusine monooxygenase